MRKWLIALVLVVALVGVGIWAVMRHSLAITVWRSRSALTSAGLEKKMLEGPAGPIVYWVGGTGSPVLLLHGTNDQAGTWSVAAPALMTAHRLIVPDLAGHGESGPASGPITFAHLLAGIERVIAAESPTTPVAIVGNSMGGWLALLQAQRAPATVRRVILEAGGGISWQGPLPLLLPTNRDEARQILVRVFGEPAPPLPGFMLDEMIRLGATSPMTRYDAADATAHLLDGTLKDLAVPVDLVWGRQDGVLPIAFGERFRDEFTSAGWHTIDGAHILHRDRSQAFLDTITPLLK
ncbi:MAG: alpha/beta fold hydrolase [Acidobacteria bacterium]|nr:alpha/beta fold hydrolase [Acidobacteriota bacterium]